jgi:hypothetical protein
MNRLGRYFFRVEKSMEKCAEEVSFGSCRIIWAAACDDFRQGDGD